MQGFQNAIYISCFFKIDGCCVFFYCYQHNSKLTVYSLLNLTFLLTFLQENERETPYRPSYLLD